MSLVLTFAGWCMIRLATDPDPTDEPRGVSGYSFAFAGEPPLDRIVRFQPPAELARSHSPDLGVKVIHALSTDDDQEIEAFRGAAVDLLDDPKLENRNHTLTAPGYEPIVPFHLQIAAGDLEIARAAPLDPDHPDQPVWQVGQDLLAAQAASGMSYEPDTVGQATGQWDLLALVSERLDRLREDLATEADAVRHSALSGRISQLAYAVAHPNDRRVLTRHYVERFAFAILGPAGRVSDPTQALLTRELDLQTPWPVAFWIGAWDPDLLCAHVRGSLDIPYVPQPGVG